MKKFLLLLLFMSQGLFAQDIPRDTKAGDCFLKCFEIDKPIYFKKIDCKDVGKNIYSEEEKKAKIEELKTHQLELKNLGYDVEITGFLDSKTEIAHNKYITKKKKEERREKRRKKKEQKE